MRLNKPRIMPIEDDDYSEELRNSTGLREDVREFNIVKTLARIPKAMVAFLGWSNYIMSPESSLPARERELITVRVGYLCRCGYVITQHVGIAKAAGLTPEEIERLEKLGDRAGWSRADAALLQACDELVADFFLSDAGWAKLLENFTERQAMDVVLTVGQYVLSSTMLNTFGVQVEPEEVRRAAWRPFGGYVPKA